MKCEEVSNKLVAYLDRRMDSADRAEVEAHLSTCSDCRRRAEEFRNVWTAMEEVPAIEPSFGFDARVRQRIAAEPQPRWYSWFVPQARLAFSAVMLVALSLWIANRPMNAPQAPVTTASAAPSAEQDFNAIKDLGVLENYDVVTKMDALSELVPAADQQSPAPDMGSTESND